MYLIAMCYGQQAQAVHSCSNEGTGIDMYHTFSELCFGNADLVCEMHKQSINSSADYATAMWLDI